jgi:hypothetical protein
MNRRRVIIGAGLVAFAGLSAFAAPGFFTSRYDEGKVTLRSRILDYNDVIKKMEPFPDSEKIDADITALMGEYFRIGMSYDECMKILEENDLSVDEKYQKNPDVLPESPIYFYESTVSVIDLQTWIPLFSFSYRIILRFNNKMLDDFEAARVGTGP